jgi:hypothetical protein
MSKEEILEQALGEDFKVNHEEAFRASVAAMDFHAKDHVIKFQKWTNLHGWFWAPNRWLNYHGDSNAKTTEELYTLFLQSTITKP